MLKIPAGGEPLSVILKLPGETCNINCYYCYEKRKPSAGSRFLEPEVLRALLTAAGGRPLAVELHGGEPLLIGRSRLRALLEEMRRYPGRIRLSIQTNGTLLSDEWLDFFETEWPAIEIGVSLDGDPMANCHRVDYRDRPIDAAVESALPGSLGGDVRLVSSRWSRGPRWDGPARSSPTSVGFRR